jgi:hypothetical protein
MLPQLMFMHLSPQGLHPGHKKFISGVCHQEATDCFVSVFFCKSLSCQLFLKGSKDMEIADQDYSGGGP